jgi:hypothetical protein
LGVKALRKFRNEPAGSGRGLAILAVVVGALFVLSFLYLVYLLMIGPTVG